MGRARCPESEGTAISPLETLLDRLEVLLEELEHLDEHARSLVVELLDGVDTLHRWGLSALGEVLDEETLARARERHPAAAWLLDTYGVGLDQRSAAESALDDVRPYIASHGGSVEILDVRGGVVALRLAGACSGCTASASTLQDHIEEALRKGVPGFVAIDVAPDDAPPHPPPSAPNLVQIQPRPPEFPAV